MKLADLIEQLKDSDGTTVAAPATHPGLVDSLAAHSWTGGDLPDTSTIIVAPIPATDTRQAVVEVVQGLRPGDVAVLLTGGLTDLPLAGILAGLRQGTALAQDLVTVISPFGSTALVVRRDDDTLPDQVRAHLNQAVLTPATAQARVRTLEEQLAGAQQEITILRADRVRLTDEVAEAHRLAQVRIDEKTQSVAKPVRGRKAKALNLVRRDPAQLPKKIAKKVQRALR